MTVVFQRFLSILEFLVQVLGATNFGLFKNENKKLPLSVVFLDQIVRYGSKVDDLRFRGFLNRFLA